MVKKDFVKMALEHGVELNFTCRPGNGLIYNYMRAEKDGMYYEISSEVPSVCTLDVDLINDVFCSAIEIVDAPRAEEEKND